jgi:hypothetical protein
MCLCACRLTYPVCHAQNINDLLPPWIHHIFRHYLINCTIFGKKCDLFSLELLFETFFILRINQRDVAINMKTPSRKEPVLFCRSVIKLEFFRQIFLKSLKYQILSKSVQWEPSCGQRDGRAYMTKLIVAFAILRILLTRVIPLPSTLQMYCCLFTRQQSINIYRFHTDYGPSI